LKRTLERIEAGASVQVPALLRVLRALGLLERFDGVVPEPCRAAEVPDARSAGASADSSGAATQEP
jgi:hypothetical protein